MRRHWPLLVFALTLLLVAAVAAQAPPPPSPNGLVIGQVVDAGTQQPVPSALVTMSLTPTKVLTDAEGRFVFGSVAPGPYAIIATKAGYLEGAYGRRRAGGTYSLLIVGSYLASTTDIKILLFRPAVVSGVVRDDAGEAVVNVAVQVFRRTIAGTVQRWAPAGAPGITDDRGVFRVSGLVPGDYTAGIFSTRVTLPLSVAGPVVARATGWDSAQGEIFDVTSGIYVPGGSAAPRVGAFALQQGSARGLPAREPGSDGSFLVYPTVFYPAAASARDAGTIRLSSGEERTDVNLTARLVPTVSVSGHVVGPDGPAGICAIRLIPDGSDALSTDADNEPAAGVSDATGAFTLLGVPQGQYVLRVTKTPRPGMVINEDGGARVPPIIPDELALWAAEPVAVGAAPITNLSVTLRQGARVTGRVQFVGGASPPAADRLPQIVLSLEPAGGLRSRSPVVGRPDASGAFKTYAAPPGRYVLGVLTPPPGWVLKSAVLGGRDVSDTPFDLADREVTGVVVTFTDRTPNVDGTVTGANGAPDVGAVVLAFPADARAWPEPGGSRRRFQMARTDSTGAFTLIGLPPAEYLVAAVREELADDWPSPALLQRLSGAATRFTVTEASQGGLSLRTSAVR